MTKRERLEQLQIVFCAIAENSINETSASLHGSIVSLLKSIGVDIQKLADLAIHKFSENWSVEEKIWLDFMASWLKPYPEYSDEAIAKKRNDWFDRVEQAMSD